MVAKNNQKNRYIHDLDRIVESNYMYQYEDIYSDFLAAQYNKLSRGKLSIIIRCDVICAELLFHIRYLRSVNVTPRYILSTKKEKKEKERIQGIEIISSEDLNLLCTSTMMLLIVNRESDFEYSTQEDYREDSFGFIMRERVQMGFFRDRGIQNYDYYLKHREDYIELIDVLEDEISKKALVECIRALIENDVYREEQGMSDDKYFDYDIYKPINEEIWINCGAATGDTILRFINNDRKCTKIYAVEVDTKMIPKLELLKQMVEIYTDYELEIVNKCIKKGDNSIDKLFENVEITLINMDVEGAEMDILKSAEKTIKEKSPVLAIAAYHKSEHLFSIPKFIKKINADYHIYFRKYRGYAPEVINEYIYYAVPTSRVVVQ